MDLFAALETGKPVDQAPAVANKKAPPKANPAGSGSAAAGEPVREVVASSAPAGAGKIGRDWRVGDAVVYRSMYSGHFLAKVTAIRFGGEQCDADVYNDSGTWLLHVTRVPIAADAKSAERPGMYKGARPPQ